MFEQTKALCQHFLNMGIPSFDLIVYKDGECVFRHMGGYADPENKIPMSGKEKYHVYSCSKLFTCVAAMQLWEKGMFSLDDHLSDYLPAYKEMTVKTQDGIKKAEKPIKILHLFQMTSGMNYEMYTPELAEYYKLPGNTCRTLDVVNMFAKTPLEFEPGEGWKYSLSHDVLAALVEVLTGERFEVYVKKNIFDPLGMLNTDFLHPLEDWEGFARQFRYDSESNTLIPSWTNHARFGKDYASGGGGCVSTVEDFIKFLEALRTGEVILKKETIKLMATDCLTEQQRAMYRLMKESPNIGYGLGMRTPLGNPAYTDFGWGGAAGAYASVDPALNVTFFYAQHVLKSPNRHLRPWLYDTIRADLFGERVEVPYGDVDDAPELTY